MAGTSYDFSAVADLSKAAKLSLERSGLFARVQYGELRGADLILRGIVRRARYQGRAYTYRLGWPGAVLWFLGAPVGRSTCTLELVLWITDSRERALWTYEFADESSVTMGLYYNFDRELDAFPFLMGAGMNGALEDLAGNLERIEADLHKP